MRDKRLAVPWSTDITLSSTLLLMEFGRRLRFLFAFAIVAIVATSRVRADPPAAEFKDGHWVAVAPPPPPPPTNDPELDHIQQLLDSGDAKTALDLALKWVKSHSNRAPLRDRCLYQIATAKFRIHSDDNRIAAYYYCDELMDEYPQSKLFYPALELQFNIANDYLNGYKDKFFGLPIIGEEDKAEEMLYRIQQRSPGSPLAEKALLRTCDYYYSQGQYQLAHDAYGFYIKSYPRSPTLAQVKLRQACSSLAQYHGVRYDLTCLIDARTELSDLIAAYPEMAREQNLQVLIVRIDTTLARKLLVTADFYRRTGALTGAVYMYRYLIDRYPDSADAGTARKTLVSMPKAALAEPPPRSKADVQGPAGPPGSAGGP